MANQSIASIASLVNTSNSNRSGIAVSRVREIEAATPQRQVSAADHLAELSTARQSAAQQGEVSRQAFEKVVSELQTYVQKSQRNLDFHVDDQTGRVIVKVIDATNDEVIRQIPSEEMLDIARRIQVLLDEQEVPVKGMLLELKA
jgi:flagellar protein FlaG